MLESECNEMVTLIENDLKDYVNVIDRGYFLYIMSKDAGVMLSVIHGYGTNTEPYEVIFTKKDSDGNQRLMTFNTLNDLKKYVKDNFYYEIVSMVL